jgi:DNA-binding XRE family transcriptional regulator
MLALKSKQGPAYQLIYNLKKTGCTFLSFIQFYSNFLMRSISDLKTKQIVSNIRKIREFRNYTQDYLAAKLQISQNAYSKIELGYSSITLNRLIEITEILEVELAEMICLDGEQIIILKLSDKKLKESGVFL